MRKLSLMFAGVLAVATTLAAAGTATAAEREYDTAQPGTPEKHRICGTVDESSASGCFQPNGEYFWLYDAKPDGYSPQIDWISSSGRGGECNHYLGAGEWGYCNKSFAESTTITFRVCNVRHSDGSFTCGDYRTVSANG